MPGADINGSRVVTVSRSFVPRVDQPIGTQSGEKGVRIKVTYRETIQKSRAVFLLPRRDKSMFQRKMEMVRGLPITPEMQEKLKAARKVKTAQRHRSTLRSDYAKEDKKEWKRLAAANGFHLAPWGEPITTGAIERCLRQLDVPIATYYAWFSDRPEDRYVGSFADKNTDWPLRAFQALMLETFGKERYTPEEVEWRVAKGFNVGPWASEA